MAVGALAPPGEPGQVPRLPGPLLQQAGAQGDPAAAEAAERPVGGPGVGRLEQEGQFLFAGSAARFPVEAYERLRARAAGPSADDQSLDAARLRGMVFSHRDWIEANSFRELHRHGRRQFFAEFDAVVCPITPTPAFPPDHNPDLMTRRIDIDGVEYPYFDQLVWAGLATMPGPSATALPAGRSPEGLPVGVQVIGPMFEDRTPLRLAELLEQKIGGFQAPR